MKILFVVPYVPSLVRVRPYNLVHHLAARGHQVTLATVWTSDKERTDAEALRSVCTEVMAEPVPSWRSAVNCLGAVLTGDPLQAHYSWSPALDARVRAAAARSDVVHVEHLRGARYGLAIKAAGIDTPVVWDSVDCISDLFAQAAQTRRDLPGRTINRFELPRTRRFEGRTLPRVDHVVVSSPIDRSSLLRLADEYSPEGAGTAAREALVSVVPNGVDLRYFAVDATPRVPDTLVFSGKMSYHANEAAVLHLLRDIMPLVWARRPETRLVIAGKDPSRELLRLGAELAPRVEVTGFVPDMRTYLRSASVAVAPLVYGAGSQYKVLEAMALGTPVVAVPRAVAPLEALAGRDVVVARDGAEFAGAIVSLLADRARRDAVGLAGRAFVERHHDWNRIAAGLESTYAGVAATRLTASARAAAGRGAALVDLLPTGTGPIRGGRS
jgi:glycosyltransferase involved in cell wall biosynthesis